MQKNVPINSLILRLTVRERTTVRTLARRSGVSRSTIERHMRGDSDTATMATAIAICEALGITIEAIRRSYTKQGLIDLFGPN